MGNPKQKWTTEEEDALRAGVNKHGTGKWKDIQRDPEFNQHLFSRSNIDLKDKWRNMVGGGSGQSARDKSRTGKAKPNQDAPSAPAQLTNVAVVEDSGDAAADASIKALDDAKSPPPYTPWIFEALAFFKEPNPNGVDLGVVFNHIEQRHEVPPNFRRMLSSRLRRLVQQDKIERGSNGYKLKSDGSSSSVAIRTPPTVTERDIKPRHFLQGTTAPATTTLGESIENAATEAAYRVADADNKAVIAAKAVNDVEELSKMSADADSMLIFANEILKRCSGDELVFVA